MSSVKVVSDNLVLKFNELTEELDQIIGEEVHELFNALKEKGEDVHDTRHFKNSIKAPVKRGENWRIVLKAKHSSILWSGRRAVAGRWYGSENWAGGGEPMLQKTGNNIERKARNVSK